MTSTSDSTIGEVIINATKVTVRRTDSGIVLFHAPSSRMVTLDDAAARLWEAVEGGTTDVRRLIATHSEFAGVPEETATFHVLRFFDILRSEGFVSLDLAGGEGHAPLLDVSLGVPSPLCFEVDNDFEARPGVASALAGGETVTLQVSRVTMSLDEVRDLAAAQVGRRLEPFHEVTVVDLERAEVEPATLHRLTAGTLDKECAADRRALRLPRPEADLTLADLDAQRAKAGGLAARQNAARVIVVIVVVDHLIVIVVIGTGGGPTAGKSRSACKTMCV